MKIVISPAKSLDFETKVPTKKFTGAQFLSEAEILNTILKKKSPKQLSKLMSVSEKLADLNWERNQTWHLPITPENGRQAVFAFKGTVYEGLDAYSLSEKKIETLQEKLRILSGQYGILKPLDLIQPYRLEMGTKLKAGNKENLYKFWGNSLTEALNNEMNEDEELINLASNEYFKVLNKRLLKAPVITPVFKDFKNGKLKVISFFAKKARGMMVRFILDNNIERSEDLKLFDREGYAYDDNLSTENELVFTR
jgi:cytoplasmic iron level regulating protein YaaA (DUF328/UPF0246 family)